jgi:hypothetical protein
MLPKLLINLRYEKSQIKSSIFFFTIGFRAKNSIARAYVIFHLWPKFQDQTMAGTVKPRLSLPCYSNNLVMLNTFDFHDFNPI